MHLLTFPESYPGLEKSFGMFWRFAPMADPYIEEWHSRDLDATIIQREVDAVNDWKKSGKGFHIMRDHPGHGAQILGGMFGARQNTLITFNVKSARNEKQQQFLWKKVFFCKINPEGTRGPIWLGVVPFCFSYYSCKL